LASKTYDFLDKNFSYGDGSAMKEYIKKDGDLFIKNENESNLLYLAASGGDLEMVKFLYEKGVPFDETNKFQISPLVVSSYNCHFKVALFLLEKGADPNQVDSDGDCVLHVLKRPFDEDMRDDFEIDSDEELDLYKRFFMEVDQKHLSLFSEESQQELKKLRLLYLFNS
jgi:ankyrin repeat protein